MTTGKIALQRMQANRSPQIVEARRIRALSNRMATQAAVAGEFNKNQETSPFGLNVRIYTDCVLTASGDTTTLTPSEGKVLSLYGEAGWDDYQLTDAITHDTTGATTDLKYDFFVYFDQSSDLYVLSKIAWTDETTRATSLDTIDGARLSSADNTWRYIGTGRYNGSTMLIAASDNLGTSWYGTGDPYDPSGADPFTGIIINADGVYGYLAGVVQASLTSLGAILAGAGAVFLDALGIRIVVSTVGTDERAYKFTNSDGSIVYGGLYGFESGADSTIRLVSKPTPSNNSSVNIRAEGNSGNDAGVLLSVDDGAGGLPQVDLFSNGGTSFLVTSGIDDLSLNSDSDFALDAANNLNMDGGNEINATAVNNLNLNSTAGDINIRPPAAKSFIVNSGGLDVDTRIASDTQTHALFVQGSDGFVGLNQSAPAVKLDVVGSGLLSETLSVGALSTSLRSGQKIATETSASNGGAALSVWSTTAAESSILDLNRSKSATIGTHAAVASGDRLGLIVGRGSDGAQFLQSGSLFFEVDAAVSTGVMPGRLRFFTTNTAGVATEALRIDSSQRVGIGITPTEKLHVSGNGILTGSLSVGGGATLAALDAGTYTPTLTNVTNVASSTASLVQYLRVGSVVTVSGAVVIDPTATGATNLEMSLPIASAFSLVGNCGGSFGNHVTAANIGIISANTATAKASFFINTPDTASRTYFFHFTYRII